MKPQESIGNPAPRPTPSPEQAEQLITEVRELAAELRPGAGLAPRVHLDTSLSRELGLDSLAMVELLIRLEKRFATSLPEQILTTADTPRDLLEALSLSTSHPSPLSDAPGQGAPDGMAAPPQAAKHHEIGPSVPGGDVSTIPAPGATTGGGSIPGAGRTIYPHGEVPSSSEGQTDFPSGEIANQSGGKAAFPNGGIANQKDRRTALANGDMANQKDRRTGLSNGEMVNQNDRRVSLSSEWRGTVPGDAPETAPEGAATLLEVLDWHAEIHPDRRHVLFTGSDEPALTYGGLRERATSVAAGLLSVGLMPGQAVAIMLPSGYDYFFSFFGTLLAGGIPVPIYPPARPNQIAEHIRRHAGILNNALAAVLITVPEGRGVARLLKGQVPSLARIVTAGELTGSAAAPWRPLLKGESPAFIQYTSGTTGNPKGVLLSHENLLANIRAMGERVGASPRDVFVSWLPLYHDMGLIGAWLGSLYFGMPLVLLSPLTFLARPERWLREIHRHGGTISGGPNFGYELCMRRIDDGQLEGLDLGSWRIAFSGAEPVSPQTLAGFRKRFSGSGLAPGALMPVYGLAESSVGLTFPTPGRGPVIDRVRRADFTSGRRALPADADDGDALLFVALGHPIAGHEIRVVDGTGRETGEREEGRLQFRGPSSTSGYFRNPEATAKLFDGKWLETGDLAYLAEGELYITGRSKDVIIRAGRNIYPQELEEAVGDLSGVRKGCVAAFGSTDPASGTERLVLLVETRESAPEERERLNREINAAVVDLAGTPPEEVVLAGPGTVLKTSSGKIRRAASRALYEKGDLEGGRKPVWWQLAGLAATGIGTRLARLRREGLALLHAPFAWGAFLTCAVITWCGVALVPWKGPARRLVRGMARMALRLTGVGLEIRGLENLPEEGASILVVNHASYIDGALLSAALPPRFAYVVKRDLMGGIVPALFLKRLGAHYVERFDAAKGLSDAREISRAAGLGQSLVFFPEGTFARMPGLRPFHMGAFTTAAESGIPIVPVAIRGSRYILRAESWFPRRGTVTVTLLPPIPPDDTGWQEAIRLRDRARSAILAHCGEPELSR